MKIASTNSLLVTTTLCKQKTLHLILLILIVTIQSIKAGSLSQNETITLNVEDKTIKNVLSEIESKTQYRFFYKTGDGNLEKRVSINVRGSCYTLSSLYVLGAFTRLAELHLALTNSMYSNLLLQEAFDFFGQKFVHLCLQ